MNNIDKFMFAIEISDGDDRPLIVYESLIVPCVGDYISWPSDDNIFCGEVVRIQYEVIKSKVSNICKRVFITVDDIE